MRIEPSVAKFEQLIEQRKWTQAASFLRSQSFSKPPAVWQKRNHFLLALSTTSSCKDLAPVFEALHDKGFTKARPGWVAAALRFALDRLQQRASFVELLLPKLLPYAKKLSPTASRHLVELLSIHAPDGCRALVEAGVNVDSMSADGRTALRSVMSLATVEPGKLLLELGANPNGPEGTVPPLVSGYNSRLGHLLLDHGADPNATDHLGWTPLMRWSEWMMQGDEKGDELLHRLVASGARLDAKNNAGKTVFDICTAAPQVEMLAQLKAICEANKLQATTTPSPSIPRPRL